jgi:hypothetical protein
MWDQNIIFLAFLIMLAVYLYSNVKGRLVKVIIILVPIMTACVIYFSMYSIMTRVRPEELPPPPASANSAPASTGGIVVIDPESANADLNPFPPSDPSPPEPATTEVINPDRETYCPLLRDRVRDAVCNYYQEIWNNLEMGEAALAAPSEMTRGEAYRVSFVLMRESAHLKLDELLASTPDRTVTTRIGRRMAVELTGEGFTVEPKGIIKKDLFVGDGARWDWTVTPVRGPKHELTVSAYVVIESPDNSESENLIKTVSQTIDIDVPATARLGDLMDDSITGMGRANRWLLALATLLGGALAVWLAIRKFRAPKVTD